jgi:short-subunit dehydrogenase
VPATVVVTGASSGIGRATALAFAAEGARLVLAARRPQPLEELAETCRQRGASAVAVPTDVADANAVRRLADTAVERFGGIDVWVNNAAVTAFTRFGEEPVEVSRRVLEVNALGQLHGARAALPVMRDQGRGVLVNVGSVLSVVPSPYQAAYVMSKAAVRALSGCLRQELYDAPGVRVCTVLIGPVDTPLFDHAANFTGWALRVPPPVYRPERVAATIVRCAARPRDEVHAGLQPRLVALQHRLARRLSERLTAAAVRRGHFTDAYAEPTSGNVLEPVPGGTTASGGWRKGGTSPVARRVAVASAGALLALAVRGGGGGGGGGGGVRT